MDRPSEISQDLQKIQNILINSWFIFYECLSFGPHDSMKITGILEKIKSKTDTQAELNDLLAYTGKIQFLIFFIQIIRSLFHYFKEILGLDKLYWIIFK